MIRLQYNDKIGILKGNYTHLHDSYLFLRSASKLVIANEVFDCSVAMSVVFFRTNQREKHLQYPK